MMLYACCVAFIIIMSITFLIINQLTVLLEYFAGEKPLDPLRSNYCVLARIVCIYQY